MPTGLDYQQLLSLLDSTRNDEGPKIVTLLNKSLANMKNDPQVKDRFEAMGLVPAFTGAAEFKKFMLSDRVMWEEVIARAQITAAD